jgi:threonine dehydratase
MLEYVYFFQVCCGGGGLIAGTAAAINALKPGTKIYGVEPETACGVHMSFQVQANYYYIS